MKPIVWNDGWKWKKQGDSHEFSLSWQDVMLPHDAVIGEARNKEQFNGTKKAFYPNGSWEYVKVFEAPAEWKEKCVSLRFEGVQNHALVYLNGNYVGSHAYGYTEFSVSLSKYLRYGEKNVLKVVSKTGDDSRWYTGGGIYRDVQLLVGGKFHIEDNGLRITTLSADEHCARLNVNVRLSEHRPAELRFTLFREGKSVLENTQPANEEGNYPLEVPSPALWSDRSPALYTLRAELLEEGEVTDVSEERFGIRTLFVSAEGGLKVNGEQVRLRGACIHHDNGVLGVRTLREAEYRRVRILKEAGFNAIRSAHHPASRHLLDACDELGVYVMDELFDMWQLSKSPDDYANDFDANWKEDIKAMTEKDFDHPSVILYSIGNEIDDLATSAGVELANRLSQEVKKHDPTRYTTCALNGLLFLMRKMELAAQLGIPMPVPEPQGSRDVNEAMANYERMMTEVSNSAMMDEAMLGGCEAVDIAGYNYLNCRYLPDRTKYPSRVIVGSETYPKDIASMWAYIKAHNNVIGDFTWTGWDYLGETGIGSTSYAPRARHEGFYKSYPAVTAECGDIDITGFRLPQSYYREIVFGIRKAPYITVHDPRHAGETEHVSPWGWGNTLSSWSFAGFEGTPLKVDVYGSGRVRLFLNGKPVGEGDCGSEYKISFTVPYEGGVLEAVGEDAQRYALRTAGKGQKLTLTPEESEGELLFLNIALTDEEGIVHPLSDRLVTLETEGCALLGLGSGAPETTETFTDHTHTTYHGRAFAVLRIEGEKLRIRASAEGVEEETLEYTRRKP